MAAGHELEMALILDTCFLIDLERRRPEPSTFLSANASERLCIASITAGELACGFESTELPRFWNRIRHLQILDVTPEVATCYSRIYRQLRNRGQMVGTNDMWIAAIAMANHLPVVTKNVEEFTRVTGLLVIAY